MLTFNFSNIYLSRGNKILDVGCGEGRHIFGAMDAQSGLNLFGIDMDIPSLEKSNEGLDFFREMDFNLVKFLQGSIYNLPFQDNRTGLILPTRRFLPITKVKHWQKKVLGSSWNQILRLN